jgi:hypothetical protein
LNILTTIKNGDKAKYGRENEELFAYVHERWTTDRGSAAQWDGYLKLFETYKTYWYDALSELDKEEAEERGEQEANGLVTRFWGWLRVVTARD